MILNRKSSLGVTWAVCAFCASLFFSIYAAFCLRNIVTLTNFLSLAVQTPGDSGTSEERTGQTLEAGSQREGTNCQLEGRLCLRKGLTPSSSSRADGGGFLVAVKQNASLQLSLYPTLHSFSSPACGCEVALASCLTSPCMGKDQCTHTHTHMSSWGCGL